MAMACKCNCKCFVVNSQPSSSHNLKFRPHPLNVSNNNKSVFGGQSLSPNSHISSVEPREKARYAILQSSKNKRVPLFLMVPIDFIGFDDTAKKVKMKTMKIFTGSLYALKVSGFRGVAVEVWWGIVECSPLEYDWSIYEMVFKAIAELGLKVHVALSFHSNMHMLPAGRCGVGLPPWIQKIGDLNKDIYYRDKNGFPNDDYLTLGVDQLPLFSGRTALQCYEDFMSSFVNKFGSLFGSVIEEISVGLGPSGELRYPSHPTTGSRWKFPGVGEFQCYDKYMMEDLKMAAYLQGMPQWGDGGPKNAGNYNTHPHKVPFFDTGYEGFISDYGRFFLEWYSERLIGHADAILEKAADLLKEYQQNEQTRVVLAAKIGGIYWWYYTVSHAAELTAGYYNNSFRDGYGPIASMLSRHGAALQVPCWDMKDDEMVLGYRCSPETLLTQIQAVSEKKCIQLIGCNTETRFDRETLQRIYDNCYLKDAETLRSFTYYRMNADTFRPENWNNFGRFAALMNRDL